jgi:uncharacterized OB-fold protein
MAAHPRPAPDALSAPFWSAAAEQRLVVQRCGDCGKYQHPPLPFCFSCASVAVSFVEVSGRGTVYSYTQTTSGVRHPYWQEQIPFISGVVELEEQPGLFMMSNFPGSRLEDLRVGKPVQAEFEQLDETSWIPQFRLVTDGQG